MEANVSYAKDVLVSSDWVAEHLHDDGVVLAEVDENTDLYEEGHIPGAVKLHWKDDLQDPIERDIVDKDRFEQLLGERGIGNDTTVVLYGDRNNWFAAYAYWYLKVYGHADVRIVDGGRQKWIDEAEDAFHAAEACFDQLGSASLRAAAWVARGDLAARRGDDRLAAHLFRTAAEALQDVRF